MPSTYKKYCWLELVIIYNYARLYIYYVWSRWTLKIYIFSLRVSIYIHWNIWIIIACTWFSELCAQLLVRCKQSFIINNYYISSLCILIYFIIKIICTVMHALGTRLLQKCLRHSPPGVVCTQVWNLKELTEGHHKNAWSMWLNLTQRGKSYRVRTHWGLTGYTIIICCI